MWTKFLVALSVACLLASCASTSPTPYWDNPQWINALATSVHDKLHYPSPEIKSNFSGGNAIVVFTYDNGKLESPRIIKSTGSHILDAAIVTQIANIAPPPAQGMDINTPHDFQMAIGLFPDNIELFKEIHDDLAAHAEYPRAAIVRGDTGWVLAGFKYKDGIVSDSKILKSSGSQILDQAVLDELRETSYPEPPVWLKGKTLSFEISFCYTPDGYGCPNAIMRVRYVSAGNSATPSKSPCAMIGYEYKHGDISNVRLIESSGDPSFDKRVLAEAKEGQFPHPSRWDNTISDYNVPICNNGVSEPDHQK